MTRAIRLAKRGLFTTDPNPRVGCVVVKEGRVVGQGWHERAGQAHAEIHALEAAGEAARDSHVYVTLEPCSRQGRTGACAKALIDAGVQAVTYAHDDPNPKMGRGAELLRAAGIMVRSGLLEANARRLNPGFIKRQRSDIPWVRLKLAGSLDGRLAAADRTSQWITSKAARNDVQQWRARSSALLTGGSTLRTDNPRLSVRIGEGRQPLRVILTRQNHYDDTARAFAGDAEVLVLSTSAINQQMAAHVEHMQLSTDTGELRGGSALRQVLKILGKREINELHIECGPELAGAWMRSGLVDELLIYQSDCLLGDAGLPLFAMPQITTMQEAVRLPHPKIRQLGHDRRLHYLFDNS